LRLDARCGERAAVSGSRSVTLAAGQSAALDLALELPARGDYATTLTLQRGAETLLTLHPPLRVPELLTVALSRRHVFTRRRARRCSSSSRPNCERGSGNCGSK